MKHVDDATLKEIVRRLVAEFQPEAVILFGSHAWGTPPDRKRPDVSGLDHRAFLANRAGQTVF